MKLTKSAFFFLSFFHTPLKVIVPNTCVISIQVPQEISIFDIAVLPGLGLGN